jgi:uncharacterized phage protein (TIGR01671 family)
MNREIKFRAWVDDEMIYPENSQYLLMFTGTVLDTRCKESNPVAKFCGNYDVWSWAISHNEPRYIMQFTGLTDKNGKDIYEGDIIKTETDKALLVTWNEKFASFCLNRQGWMFSHFFGEAVSPLDCEVIGNIHENKELLTP